MATPVTQVRARRPRGSRCLMAISAYAFLGWAYVAANSVTHPETLRIHLTHFSRWPLEGTFALACFIVSAACFFVADLASE